MYFSRKERIKRKKNKLKDEIALLELKHTKLTYKKLLNSGKFSKKTIIFCISFVAFFAIICLYAQYKTGYDTYPLLRIVGAVFGGELLLLLFKRIFSSEDAKFTTFISKFTKKKNKQQNDTESNNYNISMNTSSKSNSNLNSELENATEEINSSINGG